MRHSLNSSLFVISLIAALFLILSSPAAPQQTKKFARIGFLSGESQLSAATRVDAFTEGLHQLGYVAGQNISIEYRYADGKLDRLPELATDLVRLKVDVIVAVGATTTTAAKKATESIPIVMTNATDPVLLGLVVSLAKPAGNITGLSNLAPNLGGKRLELLKEIVPHVSRVVVIGDPTSSAYYSQKKEVDAAAAALSLDLQVLDIRGPNDLDNGFSALPKSRFGALILLQQPSVTTLRGRIAEFATKNRLPSIGPQIEVAEAGVLMSYGANTFDLYRRAAIYIDKILKGTKPSDLPIEQPTKFDFVINLKTANQIGLTIPPNVLARADKLIR